MRVLNIAVAAALIGGASYAYAQQMSSEEFVTMAASSDLFEVQSGQLAAKNSKEASVQQFAEMMVAGHKKASQELKVAAGEAKVTVPVASSLRNLRVMSTTAGSSLTVASREPDGIVRNTRQPSPTLASRRSSSSMSTSASRLSTPKRSNCSMASTQSSFPAATSCASPARSPKNRSRNVCTRFSPAAA